MGKIMMYVFNILKFRISIYIYLALSSLMLIFGYSDGFSQFNHSYPRTGIFHWGGAPLEWYARFDLVVIGFSDDNLARGIKDINSNTIVLCSVKDWNTFSRKVVPDEWYVRDSKGNKVLIYGGVPFVDISNYCPKVGSVGNKRYNLYLAEHVVSEVNLNILDGIASHGVWSHPFGTSDVDIDRNGKNDWIEHGRDWLERKWLEGVDVTVQEIRRLIGNNKIILLNSGRFHEFNWAETNGMLLEDTFLHYSFRFFNRSYREWMKAAPEPHCLLLDGIGVSKDQFFWMRYLLGTTLLGDGYFSFSERPSMEHHYDGYYDEFDVELGMPTSGSKMLRDFSDNDKGVYVRFFENGAVIVNVSENNVDISDSDLSSLSGYDGPYWRLKGGQVPHFNNGNQFSQVTLVGQNYNKAFVGDAIILLKSLQTVISDIVIDSDDEGTSPGSNSAQYFGSWNQIIDNVDNAYVLGARANSKIFSLAVAVSNSSNTYSIFQPKIGVAGKYNVYEWHGMVTNRNQASNVTYEISNINGIKQKVVDQSRNFGKWNLLGEYEFTPNHDGCVKIKTNGAVGAVVADAIKFEFINSNVSNPGGGATNPLTGESIQVILSADNNYELYVNGNYIAGDGVWETAEKYSVPAIKGKNIIAIKCVDNITTGGIVAEVCYKNSHFVSSGSWKVNANYHSGWKMIDFDDSSWENASVLGIYGNAKPWSNYNPIQQMPTNRNIYWIWTKDNQNDKTVYFRFTFDTDKDIVAPQPPLKISVIKR